MSYGQYNREQGSSDSDGADALEQTLFDSDHLFEKYRNDLAPLLQEAELRLDEMGLKKFKNMEGILKNHVNRWYRLNKQLSETALEYRTLSNRIHVDLQSAKVEIDERDKIINTQRKEFQNDREQYENQLKVLESALANSIPRNNTLDRFGLREEEDDNMIIKQLKKDLKSQEQQFQKLSNENKKLNQHIITLKKKTSSDDYQQTIVNLNSQLAKKEEEIMKLRWLTQDLAAERNGLEAKVQTISKNPNFTSVTPQRQQDYGIDLSKYIDDDAEDLSDDAAENGMLLLEMTDDTDIDPQVAKKLAEALEAVKKVAQFANDRDNQAKQFESQFDDDKTAASNGNIDGVPMHNHSRKSVSKSPNLSKPSEQELYANFEQIKKLKESSPSQAHTLLSQMGGFKSLTDYIDQDDHYTAMLKRVESEIENGSKCIEFITKCINDIMDNKPMNGKTNQVMMNELENNGISLLSYLNNIMIELRGAAQYIHPDHKKVELLRHKMRELELTMPYIEAEQLAILNSLPSFLKQELNKLKQRPNRIRTKEQEQLLDDEDEKQRQMNFDNSLCRVEELSIQIKQKTDIIKNGLRANLEKSQTDPKAFAQYLQQIDIACDQISEFTLNLDDEFHFARDYIHPSQAALIEIINQYNNLRIECEKLDKTLAIKQGEINAYQEIKDTRPKPVINSVVGPPPGFPSNASMPPPHNPTHEQQKRDESFQFDDIEKDFMKYATQNNHQLVTNDNNGIHDNNTNNNNDIVPKMAIILDEFKSKTALIQNRLSMINDYEINNQLNDMLHLVDDMNNNLIQAKQIIGPTAKYVSRLEKRYVQIMGLYQMKYAEVEHKSDLLFQSDRYITDLKEDISDLDYRLGAVMSSAVSNVETRMTAFNDMGIKIQTFQKVMKLIDDTYVNIQQACQDIQESVEKDLYDIVGEAFDDKQHQECAGMIGNVAHACDYILKAFDDIGQEMDGVGQFVHPDREMVEQLQLELIAMYENQEKQQQEMQIQVGNMQNSEQRDQVPTKRHPDIKPGESHDDIALGARRKSILDFHEAFDRENKRRSKKFDNKLQQEDRKRSRHSQKRRSSIPNNIIGLLPPVVDDVEPTSKSDMGGHTMQDPMNDEDRLYLKSLAVSLANVNVSRLKETPANSPLNSPNNAPSPVSEEDDKNFTLHLKDAVDEADLHGNVPLNNNENNKRQSSQMDAELLQKQIDDKAQLIQDLQTNLRELSENRRRELLHFQKQLESMKSRCREWYEQLMERVREMETAYQDKINDEIGLKQQELEEQLNDERLRMKQEFEHELSVRDRQRNSTSDTNAHEMDELRREIARLNEELEKFKGKYFDAEQRKIELQDELDEIKEEKFKMEGQLEELANKVNEEMSERARTEQQLRNVQELREEAEQQQNNNNSNNQQQGHRRRTTAEWNDLVQKLREEKENQENQYEEEFREFERMANEKVVQLEEYYVQQLQVKEAQVVQLQAQLQQQILAKQQQQQQQQHNNNNNNGNNNNNNSLQAQQQNQQLNEQLNNLKKQMSKNQELTNKLSADNNKLQSDITKLQYQEKLTNEQLSLYKKKNESNDSKISAYNASFIELAEKLKQLNDDTKTLRKDKDKAKKKCDKLEKQKKKLKKEIKDLNEKIENITAVTKELVKIKRESKLQSEQWDNERMEFNEKISKLEGEMLEQAKKKFESINAYNVEMNNLRANIKTLQKRIIQQELENDKLRETDSQSVLGSAANWVPGNWWSTKK